MTDACDYDGGGDCSECAVIIPSGTEDLIGNGICDGGVYMQDACSNDGGDCSNCKATGDGYCHKHYNTEACGWDAGDCLIADYPNCHVGISGWINDGQCDDYAPYNTEACGWDGGDCPN